MATHHEILEIITNARSVCFLTGAGVSTASGIPDFQDVDTEWSHALPREQVISKAFFKRNPEQFWIAYRQLFGSKIRDCRPNEFHQWIAELSQRPHKRVTVVTQNVDGLHEEAGSGEADSIFAIHGNAKEVVCLKSGCRRVLNVLDFEDQTVPECPHDGTRLKPNVVLFGEYPQNWEGALQRAMQAEVLVVAGTSLEVFPANSLPRIKSERYPLDQQIWMNKDSIPELHRRYFDHSIQGDLVNVIAS